MFGWFKKNPLTLEAWSTKHSNKCSPEDLIVAHVISEIAKDPKGFLFSELAPVDKRNSDTWAQFKSDTRSWSKCTGFSVKGNGIEVSSWIWRTSSDRDGTHPWIYFREEPTVNGVKITAKSLHLIVAKFKEIQKQHEKLEATAAKAQAEMTLNEQQWNLAEKFLGMKRNGLGALIPVSSPEEDDIGDFERS